MRAVGRYRLAVAPVLGQVQAQIQLDQLALRGLQPLQAHVPPVDKRHHVRRDAIAHVARGLGRPQVAAHREDGQQIPLGGVADLGITARQRPKVPGELGPVLDVGQHVEQIARRHAAGQRLLQGGGAGRDLAGPRCA